MVAFLFDSREKELPTSEHSFNFTINLFRNVIFRIQLQLLDISHLRVKDTEISIWDTILFFKEIGTVLAGKSVYVEIKKCLMSSLSRL